MIDKNLFTKRYYSISEVAKLFGIAPSVLRYWESEFKSIKPTKGRNGVRRYTIDDITEIETIHDLLKIRGFTIEGAKKELKTAKKGSSVNLTDMLIQTKQRLDKIKGLLSEEE